MYKSQLHDVPFQADSLFVGNKITVDHLVPGNNMGPAAAQISVGLDLPFYFIQVAVEMCIRDSSKATAIERVLEYYGLPLEAAYVFGDSSNDLAMFEYASNCVVMELSLIHI